MKLQTKNKEISAQKDEISAQKDQLEDAFGQLFNANRQLAEANIELERLATHDGLTGIPNHRRFAEFLANEWKRSARNKSPLSLILLDVDFFKKYNDGYGHQAGDDCLKKVAAVLADNVKRPTDIVARYGGEEFVIVLSETDSAGAAQVAEMVRAGVEEEKIKHEYSDANEYVTISLGCTTTIANPDSDPDLLVKSADEVLYKSKESGRNRVTVTQI